MEINLEKKLGYLEKADSCKPVIMKESREPVKGFPVSPLNKGDRAVFDFGAHYVGKLQFHCSYAGRHPDAPAFIKVKFCEAAREIGEDSSSYEGWISRSWIQEEWLHIDVLPAEIAMPRRYAFRFVVVEVIDVSDKFSLVIDKMEAETYTSGKLPEISGSRKTDGMYKEGEHKGIPGNDLERKLEKISLRTLQNCMQDVFEDGPKRDRRLWIGDLRLQALTNYVSFRNNDLVKRCLYLFAGTTDDRGRVKACLFTEPKIEGDDTWMFDYSLFFIPALLDYYEASGDRGTAEELLGTARRQLEISREYFDEKHLVKDSDELGWCFLDWNLALNKQTGAQAVYIYCGKAMIRLMEELGETAAVNELKEDVRQKIRAARNYLYDEKKGLFVSGEEKQVSYASQVWGVLAGIFDEEQNGRILKAVRENPDAVSMVTPYMYHHYVEALVKCGCRKEAYEVMAHYWGAMVKDGADTFYELFNPDNPDESPYGSPIVNSYCHAWSCTPVYFMRHYGLTEQSVMRQKEIKAIIFDLDGVIVSTDRLHYQAWKRVADRLGIHFDEQVNHRLRGVSRRDSLEIILEQYHGKSLSGEEKAKLTEEKNGYYREMLYGMRSEDVPEEVRVTLKQLRKKGYALAIGSSSRNAKIILEQVHMTEFFDAVSDGTNISRSKPDPEVFLKAAEYLGVNPQQCAVVEDAKAGIDAAKAGDMLAVAVGDAASYERADRKIRGFAELLELFSVQ